ncbi:MAG: rhomboid family intramembrane serine protease [Pseudomonadota bacterium]
MKLKNSSLVAYSLIIITVFVAILTKMGKGAFTSYFLIINPADALLPAQQWLKEPWRLVTPMLIHYGFFHIFFNMLWLRDAGSLIESKRGSWFLLILVFLLAAISNYLQFHLTGHHNFGGMSGVVYGLFGYIWMQGKHNPHFGFEVDKNTVIMMLVWFFVCLTGWLGNVANWAHGGGLVAGMVFARIEVEWMRWGKNRAAKKIVKTLH